MPEATASKHGVDGVGSESEAGGSSVGQLVTLRAPRDGVLCSPGGTGGTPPLDPPHDPGERRKGPLITRSFCRDIHYLVLTGARTA